MKFIHLTDPHLVAPPADLFGIDGRERLAKAVASIARHHADAELCVITGDITHWAEPGAYAAFEEIVSALPMPWQALIGNHDGREEMRAALPALPWADDGFLHYPLDTSAGRFLILDTVDPGVSSGRLCEKRLAWLKEALADSEIEGLDVFLFMHHAPMDVGIPGLDAIRLLNADDFAACIAGFDNLRHLFFGHLHRACHGSWKGLPFSTVRATAHQIAFDLTEDRPLAGSAELPDYAVVLIEDDKVVIHDHSYLEEDAVFEYTRGKSE